MRKIVILAALAAATVASPALAQSDKTGEGRVEVRGGIAWAQGQEEAFAGVAAGYDFDLGDTAFVGAEVSADKVLAGGADVLFSVGGRVGAKIGDAGRVYALAGYGFTEGDDGAFAGAGYQHNLGEKIFAKIEYRRTLVEGPDVNFAGVGVGLRF
ncbi:outer membrane beta-barrel protein [Sphingomonas sp. ST-64]|uniref:Outer membrane beta-barrel protein n=1 Tax=Sphingomonas plantiphila TaxID=3163295 RepID=A0ABW8YHT8_9SPHN